MLATHLHARSRNDPDSVFEVKLAPVRQSQFRGTSEHIGQDFQAIDHRSVADIGVNIPQKLPDVVRQGDGGEMRCLHWCQGFGQPRRHIIFDAACDAGIACDLSAQAHEFVGCFVMAETLRGLNELQKVGRFKLGDRLSANDRENRIFQITAQFFGVLFRESRFVLGEPFPRHKFKSVARSSRSLASFSSLACFFSSPGSIPLASNSLASSRRWRASFRETAGYAPKLNNFCLPSNL